MANQRGPTRTEAPPLARPAPSDPTALLHTIRQVVRRYAQDPVLCEELSQQTLLAVLRMDARRDVEDIHPYARVAARNVIRNHRRDERNRADKHARLSAQAQIPGAAADVSSDGDTDEERRALRIALAQLGEDDRRLVAEIDAEDVAIGDAAERRAITPSTTRVRLHRARARLRTRYLLAVLSVEPPTPQCLPVLDAASARDRTSEKRLDAEAHVQRCETCERLVPLLRTRQRPALLVLVPLAATWRWVRDHPIPAAAGGVATAGALTGAVLLAQDPAPRQLAPHAATATTPATTTAPTPATVPTPATSPAALRTPTRALLPVPADVATSTGEVVVAEAVTVVRVVGDEAFWVGDAVGPMPVVLTGGESPPTIEAGQRLTFTGLLVPNSTETTEQFRADPDGVVQLNALGVHIELGAGDVEVLR